MSWQQKLYGLLDAENGSRGAHHMRALEVVLILIGIGAVGVGTMNDLTPARHAMAATLTGIVATVFLLEYLVRLWVAPASPHIGAEVHPHLARWRWAISAEGLIDLVAILPMVVILSGGAKLGADSSAAFVLLWVVKLATHAPGVSLIARVVRNERSALSAVAVLFVIVLLSGATLAYFVEEEAQPQDFSSIPSALWWAIVTLTTTGYGDVVPKTGLGRMIGGVLMVCGIAVLALLAGILANGFAEEVKRREFVRIWELVAKVPFFADIGAIAISDIVVRLRSRTFPAGAVILRRGTPGDAMYFIVSGEVEVRIGAKPIYLRDGAFFGEMALLDRRPRAADVLAVTPCMTLVLDVADFYQIAGQQPALIQAIEAEAKRRHAANKAGPG
jgi:voltage-gated potassium channel